MTVLKAVLKIKSLQIFHQNFARIFSNFGIVLEIFKTSITVKNTLISPYFVLWKFCGKAPFPHSFGRFARNYVETVPFHKISITRN